MRCAYHKETCFTVNFPGVTNKCRVHDPCCGKYVTPGSVSIAGAAGAALTYYLFRNFVSFLSCLALMGRKGLPPPYERPSLVMLGSIGGLSGTLSQLGTCGGVCYFLSGSSTKQGTISLLQRVGATAMCGIVRTFPCCGSIGSLLHSGGEVP